MERITTSIKEALESIEASSFRLELSLSYTLDNETHNVDYTPTQLLDVFCHYWDWCIINYEGLRGYDALRDSWETFKSRNIDRFNRMFMALDIKYNPTHNYDKHSEITTEHDGTITNSHDGTIEHGKNTSSTMKYAQTKDTTVAPQTTTTTSEGAFDTNGNLTDSNKVINSGGTGTVTSDAHNDEIINTGADTDTFNNSDTETFDNTDKVTEYTRGNVGVTQSSELVQNELALRRFDLLHNIVHQFMCEVGYLSISYDF